MSRWFFISLSEVNLNQYNGTSKVLDNLDFGTNPKLNHFTPVNSLKHFVTYDPNRNIHLQK